jgi:hypothetical protein
MTPKAAVIAAAAVVGAAAAGIIIAKLTATRPARCVAPLETECPPGTRLDGACVALAVDCDPV